MSLPVSSSGWEWKKQLNAVETTPGGEQQTWFGSLALPLSSRRPQARLLTSLKLYPYQIDRGDLDKAPHWVTRSQERLCSQPTAGAFHITQKNA